MPAGDWVEGALHLGRNHYDRLVHFCFELLLAYPVEELFRLAARVRGWLLYYLPGDDDSGSQRLVGN
jgi:putative membrane protein